MLVEVKVPVFPESVTEGTLMNWYKEPGDRVERDESLIDLETAKTMMEIKSPAEGIFKEIKKENNSIVHGGEIIAIIEEVVTTNEKIELKLQKHKSPTDVNTKEEKINNMAPIHDIESLITGNRSEQRVPMSRLRMNIAARLKQAQDTAAILTTFNEINMKSVMDLRARHQDKFQNQFGIKIGYMSFFARAVIEALKKYPIINAFIDGNDIVYHGYFDLGIAVSTDRGLVVPILRDADQMSFADMERKIREFGEKAKQGTLSIEELSGGTFTITNGGVFGSMLSTPILNPPQSAILGMHKIEERPIVENSEIVARPVMYVALSYDHRIVDGHEAVLFLKTIKEFIEDPARMLLQI